MRYHAALLAWVAAAAGWAAAPAAAQDPEIRAYYLNVASGAAEGPLTEAGASVLQRLRFMLVPSLGPLTVDVAYEQLLLLTSTEQAGQVSGVLGVSPSGGEWLDLQGTLVDGETVRWNHRLDRLSASLDAAGVELTVGRQPISWATTLFLTPADPFAPFNPEDPFREYRAGVDALRLRGFLGAFTDLDFVLRPTSFDSEMTITGLGRLRTALASWELAAWGGVLHEQPAAALGVTATLAGAAFRAEGSLRRETTAEGETETVLRFAVGADRSFRVGSRDLYMVAEYQRDGFGAPGADELVEVALSDPFARGELQVLGRDTGALQGTMQLGALWTVDLLLLANLGDPSLLVAPGATRSLSDEVVARGGLFLGLGRGEAAATAGLPVSLPGSEYGPVPAFAYLSLTAFF